MRALLAIFITIGLLAAFYVVSALIYFDITGILVWVTSLWVGIDSAKIGLNRYKMGIACRPITLFCICILLWFIIFPWYLWARFKIKDGTAVLKNEPTPDLEEKPIKHFFRQLSRVMQRMAEWALMVFCALIFIFLLFCLEESWRGPRVWENYKHQLEAKGETFDWDAMIPPRVPDSQNFFSAPMMSEWFIRSSGKNVVVDDIAKRLNYSNSTPAVIIAEVTIELPGSHLDSSKVDASLQFGNPKSRQQAKELIQNIVEPSAFGVRGTDTLVVRPLSSFQIKPLRVVLKADKKPDIREFIAFFTGNDSVSGPLFFKPAGTNSYHILTSFCIAPDYLKWSDQFQINFDMMREAVKRPYARMDGDYSNPLMIPIPNYVAVRAVSQTLAQRAQCLLLLGQPARF